MAQIGLDNLVYAIMTDEENETYGEVKSVKKIKSADINPRTSQTSEYADDMMTDSIESLDGIDITIENSDIPIDVLADWHGHEVDTNGVLIKSVTDAAPYIAIGFRSKMSNGKYRYKWLYKCKAQLGQESAKTKGEKTEFQSKTTTFVGIPRKRDGQWQASVDDGDTGLGENVISSWFGKPYGETA